MLSGKKIIFPFYHAVENSNKTHLRYLYKVKNERQFKNDLDYLLKVFKPISVKDFIDGLYMKKREVFFLLTFDDGLSSFKENVVPILLKRKITAINFLNSKFIDNGDLFYRYKVSILIDKLENFDNKTAKYKAVGRLLNVEKNNYKELKQKLLTLKFKDSLLIDEIASILHISFEDFLKNERPYLGAKDLIDLFNLGFQFGGHSIDHPLYNEINEEEQLHQTIQSIDAVNNITCQTQKIFSFPFSDDGVKSSLYMSLEEGSIISFGSAGIKNKIHKNHFQRIPMEYGSIYTAKQIIKGELFYYLLKKIFKIL
ncbi:hypothetical protein KH5_03190 [Urechidicola sp. KH5]